MAWGLRRMCCCSGLHCPHFFVSKDWIERSLSHLVHDIHTRGAGAHKVCLPMKPSFFLPSLRAKLLLGVLISVQYTPHPAHSDAARGRCTPLDRRVPEVSEARFPHRLGALRSGIENLVHRLPNAYTLQRTKNYTHFRAEKRTHFRGRP